MIDENYDAYSQFAFECPEKWILAANHVLRTEIEQLQMISTAALKLLQLSQDENAQIETLTKIFETEPALAARVLNIVNSVKFSLSYKVQSISHALSMIGLNEIREVVTEQLLYNQIIDKDSRLPFDQLFFWQHCLFVANLSKNIAIDLGHSDPDSIYTAGLLHDIGKLVLEHHGKISYSDFLLSMDKSEASAEKHERIFFGLSHTEIGLVFCQRWNLPTTLTAVVAAHHDSRASSGPFSGFAYDIAIVACADYIAWLHGMGSSKAAVTPALSDEVVSMIDLGQLDLEDLLDRTDRAMADTGRFYGITFPNVKKLRATLLFTAIKIGLDKRSKSASANHPLNPPTSLLLPHHSLDSQAIVLTTLEAIRQDFGFDRVIMFGMSRDRQGLLVKHCYPEEDYSNLMIPAEAIGGDFLRCLRKREAVIIGDSSDPFGQIMMRFMGTDGFIAAPVLRNNRLVGVLYADYKYTKRIISPDYALQLMPIATQLGIALLNAKKFNMLKIQSEMDPLTRLLTKAKVEQLLTEIYASAKNNIPGFAIGFVDIDFFKKFNDTCGHQAGDDALKIVAGILRSLSRPNDFVGRYGGEEFVFALRNVTRDGARVYAERMRFEVEKQGKILSKRFDNLALTVSIGVALYHSGFHSYLDQVRAADQAMYQAKNQGRNRVIIDSK